MWAVVYIHDEAPWGWYLIDIERHAKGFPSVLSGPYDNHEDAVQAAETRSHRLAQGWAP